jgi:hypothetical protein
MTCNVTASLAGLEGKRIHAFIQRDRALGIIEAKSSSKTSPGLSQISVRAFSNPLLMLTRNYDGILLRHQALGSLRHVCWRRDLGMPIKDDGHLLQGVASRFWVEEVYRDAQKDEHDDEDEVVLPADAFQSDGVDESIEEDRDNGSRQSYDQTTRTQAVRPDLAGISSLERCPEFLVSIGIKTISSAWTLTSRYHSQRRRRRGKG